LFTDNFVIVVLIIGTVWWIMNWRYGDLIAGKESQIASKEGQIQLQDRQIADYKSKLDGASPDQAKAKIEALEARLARVEPRRLSVKQRENLTTMLRPPQGSSYAVDISRDMACADCPGLVADFNAAFNAAGSWAISNPMVGGVSNLPPLGIGVRCADTSNPTAEAKLVMDALRGAGIPFNPQSRPIRSGVEIFVTVRVD
jgi:hypothetical protein